MAQLMSIKRNVEMCPGQVSVPAIYHVSQGDKGTRIILGLVNNSANYTIPEGTTATIRGHRADGTLFTEIMADVETTEVKFNLTEDMSAVPGRAECEAVLASGSANIIGTANFIIDVEKSPASIGSVFPGTDAAETWLIDELTNLDISGLDNESVVGAINSKANESTIAPEFDTSTSYTAGQYVYKNGVLYRFTAAHSGAWTGTNAVEVTVGGDLGEINDSLEQETRYQSLLDDGNVSRKLVSNKFVHGSYVSGVLNTSYKYIIATVKMIHPETTEVFYIEPGFRARSYRFDENGTYIAANAWTTGNMVLNAGNYYQVCIARETSSTNEIADIVLFASKVYAISRSIDDNSINIKLLNDINHEKYFQSAFVRGSRANSTGAIDKSVLNRVTSEGIVYFDKTTTFIIENGFYIRVSRFADNGTFIASESAIQETVTFYAGNHYAITIYRATENSSEIADVYEFVTRIHTEFSEVLIHPDATWILGSRSIQGNLDATMTYRATCNDYIRTTKFISYKISSGYNIRLTSIEDGTGTRVTESNVTEFFTLKPGYNYYVTIFKDVEDTSEAFNLNNISRILYRRMDESKHHIRMLVFGHSYSADCISYVPFILKNYGITCEIYLYYRGNDSINRLVAEWEDTSDYGTDDFGLYHIRRYCHIDTRYSDRWDQSMGVTGYSPKMVLQTAVADGPLDVITLQTAPTEVYFTKAPGGSDPRKGYEPYVRKAIDLIRESYSGTYILGWFCAYTRILPYDGNETYGYPPVTGSEFDNRVGALKAAQTICAAEPIQLIIPAAASVFNARTNANLSSTNVSELGNLWYSDAVHLQNGIPMYIGSLSVVQAIFNKIYPQYSVMGDTTVVTDAWASKRNCLMPSIHGSVKSWNVALRELAQKCAIDANNNPFDITPIYNASDLTELEMFDAHNDRYWADALIDTSGITSSQMTQQAGEA